MSATTPTARALAHCKALGWIAGVVERWLPYTQRKVDLFGFADLVAIEPGVGIVLIQVTTGANAAARIAKIQTTCRVAAAAWLAAGGRIEVWGWGKRGPRGKVKRWTLRRIQVFGSELGECAEVAA